MRTAPLLAAALAAAAATTALASDGQQVGPGAPPATGSSWEFELSASRYGVRGGDAYTAATLAADRSALHFEARYDYEGVGARSAFVGWTFSGGDETTWELTPLLGGVWGNFQAFAPGLEATVAWGRIDFYLEAEYVRDNHDVGDSYFYAWSELGFQPVPWLRIGIVGERTRAYGGDRNVDRGPFAQWTGERITIGGTWLNPGAGDQVFVGLISAKF